MASLFISYPHEDNEFADKLANELRLAGHTIWQDRTGLRGGDDWVSEIDHAVNGCEICLVVISPDAIKSQWVRKETLRAQELGKPIVPVMCREAKLPVHLVDLQYVDFTKDWQDGTQRLLAAIAKPTGQSPGTLPIIPRKPRQFRWLLLALLAGGLAWGLTYLIVALRYCPSFTCQDYELNEVYWYALTLGVGVGIGVLVLGIVWWFRNLRKGEPR